MCVLPSSLFPKSFFAGLPKDFRASDSSSDAHAGGGRQSKKTAEAKGSKEKKDKKERKEKETKETKKDTKKTAKDDKKTKDEKDDKKKKDEKDEKTTKDEKDEKKKKKKTSESDREDEVKGTPDKPESDSDKPEIPKKRPSRKESGGCDTLHHRTTVIQFLRVVNSCQVIMQVLSMFFACNSSLRFFQAPNRRKKTNQQLPPKAKARKRHLSFLQFRTLFHSIAGLQFC